MLDFLKRIGVQGLNDYLFKERTFLIMNFILEVVAETKIELKNLGEQLDIKECSTKTVQETLTGRSVGIYFELKPSARSKFKVLFANRVTLSFLSAERLAEV